MKPILIFILTIHFTLFAFHFCFSQQEVESISPIYSFSITKEVKPPILGIVEGSVRFLEPGGNALVNPYNYYKTCVFSVRCMR